LLAGWLGPRRDRAISAESTLADFWVFMEVECDALYRDPWRLCRAS
jgi:hypothetical protein